MDPIGIAGGANVYGFASGDPINFSDPFGLCAQSSSDTLETRYAHNSELCVSKGETVEAGQVVSISGNTGRSKGPHSHFETRVNGVAMDPMYVLDSGDVPPVENFFDVLGSEFGRRKDPFTGEMTGHSGIDLKVPTGTPVRAVRAGVVTRAEYSQSYGWVVYIRHNP